jgi:CheY-like chemotaxis protein
MTKKILAVEDNATNMILISRVVEAEGYELLQADDGTTALELLSKQVPDLILLDINIPGIHGLDLARQLKADPFLAHIPLIAIGSAVLKPAVTIICPNRWTYVNCGSSCVPI